MIEEGFPLADLRRIAQSMARAADAAGVAVVAGDTKVVERGSADGLFVTTAGSARMRATFGRPQAGRPRSRLRHDRRPRLRRARRPRRPQLETALESDTAPLHGLTASLSSSATQLRWMRDPTRGGLATTLNELAGSTGLAVRLDEAALPIRPEVAGAAEILGIDPLYVANEGKLVAVVAPEARRRGPRARSGGDAAIIGDAHRRSTRPRPARHRPGGSRIVDMLVGDPLPRIC